MNAPNIPTLNKDELLQAAAHQFQGLVITMGTLAALWGAQFAMGWIANMLAPKPSGQGEKPAQPEHTPQAHQTEGGVHAQGFTIPTR